MLFDDLWCFLQDILIKISQQSTKIRHNILHEKVPNLQGLVWTPAKFLCYKTTWKLRNSKAETPVLPVHFQSPFCSHLCKIIFIKRLHFRSQEILTKIREKKLSWIAGPTPTHTTTTCSSRSTAIRGASCQSAGLCSASRILLAKAENCDTSEVRLERKS